jgi:hypothetical protein
MFGRVHALSAIALSAAIVAVPAEAVQRSFVASFGSDANTATNCGFANPCRGFTAALGVTDAGGEVVALDAAGYGAVTITKSVTITSNSGFYAGIASSTGNAVTIATPAVSVILRGLNINGIGAFNGVSMTDGTSLTIENCVISNFTFRGVFVNAPASVRISDTTIRGNFDGVFVQGGAKLTVAGSSIKANNDAGIWVNGDVASTTTVGTVSDTTATGNGWGFVAASQAATTGVARLAVSRSTSSNNNYGALSQNAAGGTLVSISGSLITGNVGIGLHNNGGTMESQGNNTVRQNATDASGTITTFSGT